MIETDPEATRVEVFQALAPGSRPQTMLASDRSGGASFGSAEIGPPPERIARFEVRGELGRGGMGRVLEAFDPVLGRSVAIKILAVNEHTEHRFVERLMAEARIAAQLEHPHIVPIYEVGHTDAGELFFVMRRVEGQSLRDVLLALALGNASLARKWTRHRLLSAFISVCNAVAFAHRRGVLHRDIKPANVMLGSHGEVQLLDWGVARARAGAPDTEDPEASPVEPGADGLTLAGTIVGTPGYISPEQAAGDTEVVDARADVWSLGAMLYEILTYRRAFAGTTTEATIARSRSGRLEDPRHRAPEHRIPDEIAEVCVRALQADPGRRFESVEELAAKVESFLDGSGRKERARRHLGESIEVWADYLSIKQQRDRLLEQERALDAVVPAWAPLDEKTELLDVRRRLADLGPTRSALFGRAIGSAMRALAMDPGNREARAFLARAYWARFREAEAAGNLADQRYYREGAVAFDDGALLEERRGRGSVTLVTDPPGAEVACRRVDPTGVVWSLGPAESLGTTPLEDIPIEMGSYVLELRHPDAAPVTYPVSITRGRRWPCPEPVRLPAPGPLGDRFVWIPGGPFTSGGDEDVQDAQPLREVTVEGFAIARFPVTMGEYCRYINALAAHDEDEAWRRSPRQAEGVGGAAGQFWARPPSGEAYAVPEVDRDGDPWSPDFPVFGVSWEDARGYAAWLSEQEGVQYRLPTELEWEKAARGVDGRPFPWGDTFDASLCAMRSSGPGRPQPFVKGAMPTDASVYGVRDLAGGVRDWCGDTAYEGDPRRRPIRGGSWDSHAAYCRLTHRAAYIPTYTAVSFGFRLVRELD